MRLDGAAEDLLRAYEAMPLAELLGEARTLGRDGHRGVISYSRKVFVPLTRLCRDSCGYCTFAKTPRQVEAAFLSPDEVLAIVHAGQAAGCHEALLTLGDKPELRYAAAREFLDAQGVGSTVDYIEKICKLILAETGLLPHVNAGVMSEAETARLRKVSVSQGLMLESLSERLCERGGAHFGSPDKLPAVRLAAIEAAGRLRVPFTSGILIGIGEIRLERVQSLLALRDLHERHGHLQEIIVQNFRAKAETRFAGYDEPGLDDLLWTAAVARLIFGPAMNIQVPPNLSYANYPRLLEAGINDWGGISPVTADHVNPEAPWPEIARLQEATEAAGLTLQPRLAVYPAYVRNAAQWIDPSLLPKVLKVVDGDGFAREDGWMPGGLAPIPPLRKRARRDISLERLVARAATGTRLGNQEVTTLFAARGGDVDMICEAADALRAQTSGDTVRYVVNRNINYTNVCSYTCKFCAFSKGKTHDHLRGRPYDLSLEEVARRAREAWDRGATEVCMQGGINPHYTGQTYLDLLRAVKDEVPDMHVHAFSPLEVSQGAATLGLPVERFLAMLRDAGLGSLPGTAAEILDDKVRQIICADKLTTQIWLDVVRSAHRVGLRTTATIMFGHVETYDSWAAHLLRIRDLQEETGGFTEFVPLPFIHMEAPMSLRGQARSGPTWREVRLMHAVARLVLHPLISNIQASWVKLGEEGVASLLRSGVNDLGGTLMNESISRAAGTQHGQELAPEAMDALISRAGRTPEQRTTLYRPAAAERRAASLAAPELQDLVMTPFVPKQMAVAR
ncbi:5-amino-6-(D-ribitylamino)uracil--L-tyrosine 4-hydroxyphenyl transferase CofH [Rhodopseudomonas palustris]|uniref:FO synthase n=1 Tax=Rhodopseudomonas palustris TaxID=1076 RepID=A0A418V0N6_RHOPL|nr:5-amino-6-(D-ribitylamino)uracil--L-tyrosine 4-hydroxyphenyl transferase CofH [Rhodopseudomonas palustris]RJF69384.1 7,8-didemethyl-8-hydroxy-5-deazariboflavin synthase subunit CofH [Rhodopseudomonas palustris]